jgi:hypothetical protein
MLCAKSLEPPAGLCSRVVVFTVRAHIGGGQLRRFYNDCIPPTKAEFEQCPTPHYPPQAQYFLFGLS